MGEQVTHSAVINEFTLKCDSISKVTKEISTSYLSLLEAFDTIYESSVVELKSLEEEAKRYRIRGDSQKITTRKKFSSLPQFDDFLEFDRSTSFGETAKSFFHCERVNGVNSSAVFFASRRSCTDVHGNSLSYDEGLVNNSIVGFLLKLNGSSINQKPLFDSLPKALSKLGTFQDQGTVPSLTGYIPIRAQRDLEFVREDALEGENYEIVTPVDEFLLEEGSQRAVLGFQINLFETINGLNSVHYVEDYNSRAHPFSSGFTSENGKFSRMECKTVFLNEELAEESYRILNEKYLNSINERQVLIDLVNQSNQ